MVGDTLHLPCQVGGLCSLESKMNPTGLYTGPYFSPAILSNYTIMVGDTVHLPCQDYAALQGRRIPRDCTPVFTFPLPSSPTTPHIMVGDTLYLPCQVGSLGSQESQVNPKGLYTRPYFSHAILSDNTVMVGDTVHLSCQVGSLGSL